MSSNSSVFVVTTGDLCLIAEDTTSVICGVFKEYEDAEMCALGQPGDWTKKGKSDIWHSKDHRFTALEQWEIK